MTQVADVMTRGARSLAPTEPVTAAARTMRDLDVGVLPVCDGERLVGLVTDRDLVVRGIAEGRAPESTALADVMSTDLRSCFDDESVDAVLERMRDARVRRLPVLNREQRLVGILSLGDVALRSDGDGAAIVLQEISEPTASAAETNDSVPAPTPGPVSPATLPISVAGEGHADLNLGPEATRHSAMLDTLPAGASDEPRPDRAPGDGPTDRPDDGRWADRGVVPNAAARRLWVLVADEAIARILQRPEIGDTLESVEELTDPAAHAKEGALHDDAQGRRAGSATHSARPNTPHRTRSSANVTSSAGEDAQHLEARSFARQVAAHLATALRQKRFDDLRIVAAPRFLGHLRKELDPAVAAVVVDELNKDLVHQTNDDLTRRLFASAEPEGDELGTGAG